MAYQQPTTDITNIGNQPGDGPLRAGGQSVGTPSRDVDLPSTPSMAVAKQQHALHIVRDLDAGPESVRDRGQMYLPRAPGENAANYQDRLERSVFFNVFGHTVEGLVGQVFRRDPVLDDTIPPVIVEQLENVDLMGTHFDVFARDRLTDAMVAGHCAILVEFPKTGGTQNAKQEAQEIRPYWVPIRKDDIVSWRTVNENGAIVLTQLVLKECTVVPAGDFGEAEQVRYRVFYRDNNVVGFRLLQINKDKSITEVDAGMYPTQTEIPVAEIITNGRKGMFESAPPLIDLAYLNIAHYQQYSDYVNSIHKTCVPVFATIGLSDPVDTNGNPAPLVLGPNTALNLPIGGNAMYISHSGQALASVKEALNDLKSDMGTLGLSMLSPSKRSAETAQAKKLDKTTEDSALAVTARGLQDGLERALAFHARYLLLDTGGSVSVNREFDEQSMQADMLTAWTGAVSNAGVPARYMITDMQEGGLIDGGEDVDDIVAEMEANAQAKQDAAAQAMQDRATTAASGAKQPKGPVNVLNADGSLKMRLEPSAA